MTLDKKALENAPSFGPEESERLLDRGYLSGMYDYYGSAPYWL